MNAEKNINIHEDAWDMSEDLVEKLRENPIDLIGERRIVTIEDLREIYHEKNLLVCDAYIENIEQKTREGLIFRDKNVYSIDHHAPLSEYEKKISSTNLAIEYVRENGPIEKDFSVVTNHTDADSVLACLIMRGIIPPDERYGMAAIAADHTGEENEIADLLQAVRYERNLDLSVRSLQLLRDGKSIDGKAGDLLEKRHNDRRRAHELAKSDEIKKIEDVYYIELDKKIDPNFFVDAIPEAIIFMTFSPHKEYPEKLEARIRLGIAGIESGINLSKLGIESAIDANWGGRWNAGSDKRGGGTDLSCEEYAYKLNDLLQNYLIKKNE
ncbi:MAG: hypothetical protein WA063_05190 [Minisyncoccia bacterium]